MNWLNDFPEPEELLSGMRWGASEKPLSVNSHIHTPYSFSAFNTIEQVVKLASEEGIRILGINDFYVMDGFGEFIRQCREQIIFPLLNIELIGINKEDQRYGLRVNDPKNPGRVYISGKGLHYPVELPENLNMKLIDVLIESHEQVSGMIDLLNGWLFRRGVDITLSMNEISEKYALKLVRERHIAKVLRLKVEERSKTESDFHELLRKIYGGKPSEKQRSDIAGIEEELRARLLKSGAPAFIPEDEGAFLDLQEIIEIILAAGGVPTYPMLLDGAGGEITEFESDKKELMETLKERGFTSVEFIPLRNDFNILKDYAEYFYDNGFSVTFGTEHNTSAMFPLKVVCKNGVPLDDTLNQISFNGAAYIAAHQYLNAKEGFDYERLPRSEMEQLGKSVIKYYLKNT
ncbi:MAG TPA: PHP domain-containing protein [Bacteroidaceae bacterium]|nr:PHP domain-containing protein [Bacteroidaceae bacterium]